MAIRTVLGAIRRGGLAIATAAYSVGRSVQAAIAAVRDEFPSLHWTRARQLASRAAAEFEEGVIALDSPAETPMAAGRTVHRPEQLNEFDYRGRVTWTDPDTGISQEKWFNLPFDQRLSRQELRDMAIGMLRGLYNPDSPSWAGMDRLGDDDFGLDLTEYSYRSEP